MKPFELYIAWRYLFSKKGHNAINIVSGITAASVAVVTAAMICVLSVMNGFGDVVEQMFSEFDPELKVVSSTGQPFDVEKDDVLENIWGINGVEQVSQVLTGQALIEYKEHQVPALLMGVDSLFEDVTGVENIITDGDYCLWDGAFERCVLGRGLASTLGINAHFIGGIHIYAPRRTGRVNMLRPDESFHRETAFIAGEFAVNQAQYDDQVMLIGLGLARELLEYDSTRVSSLMIKLSPDANMKSVKKSIKSALPETLLVQDRYEQQEDFYRIIKIEKLLTVLLMVFILMIASFNLIGSLTMLMLDKKEDTRILSSLGLEDERVRKMFHLEGWLISCLGAAAGLVLGLSICLGQQYFGWLKLGSGTDYVISAYPVSVQPLDVAVVTLLVVLVGWIASWIPTCRIKE